VIFCHAIDCVFIPASLLLLQKWDHQRDFGGTGETPGSDNRSSIVGGFVVGEHRQPFDATIHNVKSAKRIQQENRASCNKSESSMKE
jgi:hypothetical protein